MNAGITAEDIHRTFTLREAAIITGVDTVTIDQMVDDGILPKSVVFRRTHKRWLAFAALLMVRFEAECGEDLTVATKKTLFDALPGAIEVGIDLHHGLVLQVNRRLAVDLGASLKSVMRGLQWLKCAEGAVTFDHDLRGGVPVLKGTRIGVYELADQAGAESLEETLRSYPCVSETEIGKAVLYARAHPHQHG